MLKHKLHQVSASHKAQQRARNQFAAYKMQAKLLAVRYSSHRKHSRTPYREFHSLAKIQPEWQATTFRVLPTEKVSGLMQRRHPTHTRSCTVIPCMQSSGQNSMQTHPMQAAGQQNRGQGTWNQNNGSHETPDPEPPSPAQLTKYVQQGSFLERGASMYSRCCRSLVL